MGIEGPELDGAINDVVNGEGVKEVFGQVASDSATGCYCAAFNIEAQGVTAEVTAASSEAKIDLGGMKNT